MAGEQFALAVDIGGTTTKIAAVGERGALHGLVTLPTEGPDGDALAERIVRAVQADPTLIAGAAAAGVAVAGFVNAMRSSMIYNPNLPWLEDYPLRDSLRQRLGGEIQLDADSNMACLAEYKLGVGQGAKRFLCLTLGTGVGGGMVVDGKIVRVAHGGLGDIGHVIVQPDGRRCEGGCRGCAEAMLGTAGIESRTGLSVRALVDAAHCGDEAAAAEWQRLGHWLGIALASQTAILFPGAIAIAGGLAEAGELLLAPARVSFQTAAGEFWRSGVRVEKAALGWSATLVGAGLAAHGAGPPGG